jgi:hypothetical protein
MGTLKRRRVCYRRVGYGSTEVEFVNEALVDGEGKEEGGGGKGGGG